MSAANKTKIPVGTVLAGKYRVTREIGRGGMAAVYEAENVNIGKRVAIKILAQELTSSRIVVERFLREARAAASIRSPYICDVYDSGTLDEGPPFLVLELLEGESLYERMTKVRHLDVETTIKVMAQTCRGLTKAHKAQIVHRDLKPENIFLTRDEEGKMLAKILDFGLAKFYAPIDGGGGKQARLTREGAVFGTPAYMSPEQVRGQGAVDHRADLWALGCITYECLTGKTVWQTEQGVAMTFAQIASAPLPRPAALRPDLPPSFTAWFDRALDRDIDERFQTAAEFAQSLATAFHTPQPSFASLPGSPPPAREPNDSDEPSGPRNAATQPHDGQPAPRHAPEAPTVPPPSAQSPASRGAPRAPARPPPPPRSGRGQVPNPFLPELPMDAAVAGPELRAGPPSPSPRDGQVSAAGFAAPPRAREHAAPEDAQPQRPASSRAGRVAVVGALVAMAGGAAYLGWSQLGGGELKEAAGEDAGPGAADAPAASGSASAPAQAAPSGPPPAVSPAPAPLAWAGAVRDAQQAIASDDLKGAVRLLKEAVDKGGHPMPRALLDDVLAALPVPGDKGSCHLNGLGRPRTHDLTMPPPKNPVAASRPSIALGPRGAVVAWTELRDGAEHAYTVALDQALRPLGEAVDVTPEAMAVGRPELTAAKDRLVLTYWDAKGKDAGVHARFLDAGGHDLGPPVAVSAPHTGNFWPSLAATEGGFFVSWSDEGDANSEDLFLRRLGPSLAPLGEPVRLTDLVQVGPAKGRARLPSLALESASVHLAFQLEHDPSRVIEHLRVPLGEAAKGLEALARPAAKDRTAGEMVLVNTERGKSDSPSLSCGGGACYLVWHGENGTGASAAYVEASRATPLWRKKFSNRGTHPAVVAGADGRAQAVWFDGGRVVTAPLGREGLGPVTRLARVTADQPTPSITAGARPGEWYLAWLDYEAGHLEAYAARVLCR